MYVDGCYMYISQGCLHIIIQYREIAILAEVSVGLSGIAMCYVCEYFNPVMLSHRPQQACINS
jgi:hypothetical protein